MDFNFFNKAIVRSVLFCLTFVTFTGCSDKDKSNTSNTYYIEIVNFNDSLKQYVSDNIFGKVSFYKKNKLEILSVNYVTDDLPEMHYFKNIVEVEKQIKPDTKKIKIEFGGEYSVDSIKYSLQKYKYSNGQWVKTSDMGFLKATTTYNEAKALAIKEFGKQIVNNVVQYSYN